MSQQNHTAFHNFIGPPKEYNLFYKILGYTMSETSCFTLDNPDQTYTQSSVSSPTGSIYGPVQGY